MVINNNDPAGMAELADAYGSGPYGGDSVQVQVLFPAPNSTNPDPKPIGEGFGFSVYIEFNTREQYGEFPSKLYADLPFIPALMFDPPNPDQTVSGTIAVEYDFENGLPNGYGLVDMNEIYRLFYNN